MDQDGRRVRGALEDRPCLGDGRLHQVAAGGVGGFEHLRALHGFRGILGEQEAGRLGGLPHPAGRIEPRRNGERDALEVDSIGLDAAPLEQGRQPWPRTASHEVQPKPRDRPVLPDDRSDVGDRADRREIGKLERSLAPTRQVPEQQARDLERHATAGEPAVRVRAVRPMRVDQRHRIREHARYPVVVGDDDVDPATPRLGDLRHAGRTAVHGHDQPGAGSCGCVQCRE